MAQALHRWLWPALLWVAPLTALAEDAVVLPPVDVPLPEAPPPESAARKDPTAATSAVDARSPAAPSVDTAELVSQSPGALVQDTGGFGQLKLVSLRGASGSGVLVLLDGVPLNASGQAADLSRVNPAIVERYEVMRGGAGARYGSGGLGGAINIVTRQKAQGFFARATHGSFSTSLVEAGGGGKLADGDAFLVLHGASSQGDFAYSFDPQPLLDGNPVEERVRGNNQAQALGVLGRYRRALGPLQAELLAEGATQTRGVPGSVQNPSLDLSEDTRRFFTAARLTRAFEGGELSGRAYFRRDRWGLKGGIFGADPLEQDDDLLGLEFNGEREAGAHLLGVSGGVSSERLSEPSGQNPSWLRLFGLAFVELALPGQLRLFPSTRVEQNGPFTSLSPKLGARVELPRGFYLTANAGQAARAPSFVELYVVQGSLLPNPRLQPERALFADLAVAHQGASHGASHAVTLTAYGSLYENLISYEYYPPFAARAYNFDAAQVRGIEAEARYAPRPWLKSQLAYTLTDSQNLRDDIRYYLKTLPYRPRHKLFAQVEGGPRWLTGALSLHVQSSQFQNRTESLVLPARAFLHASVGSEFMDSPKVRVGLELKNLLDVRSQDIDGYPLPGRAAFATLAVSLDSWNEEQKDDQT